MSDAKRKLQDWITQHGRLDGIELQADTPLIEQGVLTSLQVMDLLLFLEELRGSPVAVEELTPGAFRDLDTIARTFLLEETT